MIWNRSSCFSDLSRAFLAAQLLWAWLLGWWRGWERVLREVSLWPDVLSRLSASFRDTLFSQTGSSWIEIFLCWHFFFMVAWLLWICYSHHGLLWLLSGVNSAVGWSIREHFTCSGRFHKNGAIINLLSAFYMQTIELCLWLESVTVLGSRMLLRQREGGRGTSYSWTSGQIT